MFTSGEEFPSPGHAKHVQNGEANTGYQSFPYDGDFDSQMRTTRCPTCGGSGRLTSEQEHELVALIPVRDNRLKPRRTVLYLGITIFLCLAIASIIIGLLFPRDVTLELLDVVPTNITIKNSNKTTPYIIIKNTLQVNNSNFFEVTLSDIGQQVTWDEHYIAADTTYVNRSVIVPPHSSKKFDVFVKTIYQGVEGNKVRRVCCSFISYNLLLIIDSTATASGLTLSQNLSDRKYNWLDCVYSDSSWWNNCHNEV